MERKIALKKLIVLALFFMLLMGQALPAFADAPLSAETLIATAKKLVGVKYKYGGTTTKGFDCSGFTAYVFDKLGIELPHSSLSQSKLGTSVKKGEWKVGDLLFFNINGKGISHVGIYIGDNKMIHAHTKHGIIIEDFVDSNYYSKRYVSSVRVASFETVVKEDHESKEQAAASAEAKLEDAKSQETTDELDPDSDGGSAIPDETEEKEAIDHP